MQEKEHSRFLFLKSDKVSVYEWAKHILYFTTYYISSGSDDDLMKSENSATSA